MASYSSGLYAPRSKFTAVKLKCTDTTGLIDRVDKNRQVISKLITQTDLTENKQYKRTQTQLIT